MTGFQPYHIHPELTEARLIKLAGVIREARRKAITSVYNPSEDLLWGIGCLTFGRICRALSALEQDIDYAWFKVVEPPLHFVFSVGGVPVRFFRGATDRKAPEGQTQQNQPELLAYQLAFFEALGMSTDQGVLRIVYRTDKETLLVDRVFFVQLNKKGEVTYAWEIPLSFGDEVLPIGGAEPPVDLPPASVELVQQIIEEEEEEIRKERGA